MRTKKTLCNSVSFILRNNTFPSLFIKLHIRAPSYKNLQHFLYRFHNLIYKNTSDISIFPSNIDGSISNLKPTHRKTEKNVLCNWRYLLFSVDYFYLNSIFIHRRWHLFINSVFLKPSTSSQSVSRKIQLLDCLMS